MSGATDADLQAHVSSTLTALADLLDRAPEPTWDEPSMCEGWRVREVVAHLTMPVRYTAAQFMAMLAEHGYDFTALSDRLAIEDGRAAASALVADLRSEVLHQWTPPDGGWHGALNHAVIHALDVTAAIGATRCSSDEAMRIVLDDLTAGGVHAHFGTTLPDATLRAGDVDWSFGAGPEVVAPAGDLALQLCGRRP